MGFIEQQKTGDIEYYNRLLKILGSLSNLFSDSSVPYLNYRISENLFCKSFNAENLSRSDVSADASKNRLGIGIKTFVEGNGNSWQKVAEFNRLRSQYIEITDLRKQLEVIAGFRNERIDFTKRNHDLSGMSYHCVVRSDGVIKYYDAEFLSVNIERLSDIERKRNVVTFNDGLSEYSFNLSKSTLYKRFKTPENAFEIPLEIISDPFKALEQFFGEADLLFEKKENNPYIYLPLYSIKNGEKVVFEKSGLNIWNAGGRPRDPNEVYLPYPALIRSNYPEFFPSIDEPFEMILPNGEILSAKVCQENGKAIMSNPNKALGEWLLRNVLNLKEGEVLTYDKLEKIGVDSVLIRKEKESQYSINFAGLGKADDFIANIQL